MFKILFAMFTVFAGSFANAQEAVDYNRINTEIGKIQAEISTDKVSARKSGEIIKQLNDLRAEIVVSRNQNTDSLDGLQNKLTAIGPAPANGASEPADISRQRKDLNKEADSYRAEITKAELALAQIEDANDLVLEVRNQELLSNIMIKQSSIFHPQEFIESLKNFAIFIYEIAASPISWYKDLSAGEITTVKSDIFNIFITMLVILLLSIVAGYYIKKIFGYDPNVEKPDYSKKVRAGLGMLIARGLIPATVLGIFLFLQQQTAILNEGSFGIFLESSATYLLYLFVGRAIIKVLFTPRHSAWRLIEVDDEKAKGLSSALLLSIIAICVFGFFQDLAYKMHYNDSIIYSLKILFNAVKAFCIIMVTTKLLYDNKELTDDEMKDEANISALSTSSKTSILISFAILLAFSISLFGYIHLSEFILNRFIFSVLVIGAMYIANKLLHVLFRQIVSFRFWTRTLRISHNSLRKAEVLFRIILNPLIVLLSIFILLALWGVSVDIMTQQIKGFLSGFNIGGIRVSIASIVFGLMVFLVSLHLFKWLKQSLIDGNLSKLEMEEGLRNSLVSALGFLGFVCSVIIAVAMVGGSFKSLTIMAGALSFGAGLGLQNIVSNFVSGIILLFERPIRVGDWVIINGQEGVVKQINMRATELEAFSKANILIPNSDIISSSVINMTYHNKQGRVEIPVNVRYNSDINLVKKLLVEIAKSYPNVLSSPEPSVSFVSLNDHSLQLQLNCFTSNINNRSNITDAIREDIITKFLQNNIETPLPQMDVHLYKETK